MRPFLIVPTVVFVVVSLIAAGCSSAEDRVDECVELNSYIDTSAETWEENFGARAACKKLDEEGSLNDDGTAKDGA